VERRRAPRARAGLGRRRRARSPRHVFGSLKRGRRRAARGSSVAAGSYARRAGGEWLGRRNLGGARAGRAKGSAGASRFRAAKAGGARGPGGEGSGGRVTFWGRRGLGVVRAPVGRRRAPFARRAFGPPNAPVVDPGGGYHAGRGRRRRAVGGAGPVVRRPGKAWHSERRGDRAGACCSALGAGAKPG
jgi:hypothetical protein